MASIGWLRASKSSPEGNATIQLDEQSIHKQWDSSIWENRESRHDARIEPGAPADARLYHILRPRPAPETESGGNHPQKKKSPTSQLPYLMHTCLCSVIYIVPLCIVEQANARYPRTSTPHCASTTCSPTGCTATSPDASLLLRPLLHFLPSILTPRRALAFILS
ncbi:uncharacterized protein TRUGW13939_02103 [Talaromyces rugulosus]|uniref:Uncharacterized protein n=1 Tax=Talaromyces rugulosus TaxID=121627 RepID=A0A7H8QPC4_TALRU|nr:uncharacterized protein TRUGW13939_02103 [Talaromyces rugulosus]QKX55013.1 hypothetical protein TRUGW13939_02103 [Talaromyces rugulosus]